MLQTARFLCSVAGAFERLLREVRKLLIRASAFSPVPVAASSLPTTASPAAAAGIISAMTLSLRRKTPAAAASVVAIQKQLLVVVAPPPAAVVGAEVANLVGACRHDVAEQQAESKRKKTACAAKRRPTRLVIPVADDAGEVATGWAAAAAAPAKEADLEEVEGEGFRLASRAGPRRAMEDAYAVLTHKHGGDSELAFYGVFDGHGGRAAVDFVSEKLGSNVVSAVLAAGTKTHGERSSAAAEDVVSVAIRAAYLAADNELLAQHQGESGGACATTALVKRDHLYVAHVGDCRAVLSRDGVAAALTADHTCAAEDERARIERQGAYVCRSGSAVWRVQGILAVSRAFGDGALKQWVVAEPAVNRVPLDARCEFLVIASDGLWDKVSNQEAVDAVSGNRATACRELVDMARRRGSRDDVTVMVVDLSRFVR